MKVGRIEDPNVWRVTLLDLRLLVEHPLLLPASPPTPPSIRVFVILLNLPATNSLAKHLD